MATPPLSRRSPIGVTRPEEGWGDRGFGCLAVASSEDPHRELRSLPESNLLLTSSQGFFRQ
eukprot:3748202-Pleurochrysis_carterae.AAC.1